MKVHNEKNTKFTDKIRIKHEQLKWIKENKDCKTQAGFLDKIINKYKNDMQKL